MSVRNYLRLAALLGAVAVMMALGSSPALAAGKPLVKTIAEGSSINSVTLAGEVNPNGAATTYQFAYGPPAKPYEHYSGAVSVGEGTSYVKVSLKVSSLYASSQTVYRLIATNKYGETLSSQASAWTRGWYPEEGKGEAQFPATYKSVGTVTIKAPIYFSSMTCQENGQGTIGYVPGTGDEITITLSACSVAGFPNCHPVLAGGTKESSILLSFTGEWPKCPFETVQLPAKEAFTVTAPTKAEVNLPLTLFANSQIGENPVTISDSSTWSLTGANQGLKFKIG
jgi:hypothetical protein